ncbi:aspartate carbamoyltransferase [Cupriavidus pinatubonensis]|uniref:aspartate carbamoyltransferase n=1 Tax=Cupriavidus pinatubonensis TaxID=248026 RepID=UPI001129D774|nr:aspartate carbamoyltransferase [Cupriavidus pinatubonensis]TPQ31728.1 aspartate carbamoyltransferase [Cupriavidus pinatubonensis]
MAHHKPFLTITFLSTLAVAGPVGAADVQRQAEVARLGADVMPFTLKGTTHIFTKTKGGGIQRVIVNVPSNTEQVALVREHLRTIQRQFSQGDFSGPTHIHGPAMPGLSELKAAKPGQIEIEYKEVPAGAELTYRSEDKTLVAALHSWFDAQLSDHGTDAMSGDQRHHNHGALMKQ